ALVKVDQRALIDKMLARYSGKFTVFRELLQNADDAGSSTVQICFKSVAWQGEEHDTDASPLPDIESTHVMQWTVRNNGRPFMNDDWDRLTRIAFGNQDSRTIGAFGVGFYSVFSVTENPRVSSNGCKMSFEWDDSQLYFGSDTFPLSTDRWTTMVELPLRKTRPMPSFLDLMQFLASSITFMEHLTTMQVFFDSHLIGGIEKSSVKLQTIDLPKGLKKSNNKTILTIICILGITIKAETMHTVYKNAITEMVELSMFTARVNITPDKEFHDELVRCMKKALPPDLEYSLIYTGKDEDRYDQNSVHHSQGDQSHEAASISIFQGLRADLNGARHTRIFIGHATTQTTGIAGHMASRFIPTIERELIDLNEMNFAIYQWNSELLYVGGLLSRAVYEWELSSIQQSWEWGAAGNLDPRQSRELRKQLNQGFIHVLQFFTFHHSTPSPQVSRLLKAAFYGCSSHPLMLLSSVGVRGALDIRGFDPGFTFLKSLPMLSEYVAQNGEAAIASLPDGHKIRSVESSDVQRSLGEPLNEEDLVSFLQWWIKLRQENPTWSTENLLHSAILVLGGRKLPLSSVEYFIDPMGLGACIPPDGPLPESLLPLKVYKKFSRGQLASIHWQEFTVILWLQYLAGPHVMSAYPRYNFTRSIDWAEQVLGVISRLWPSLPDATHRKSKEILEDKCCIPTSQGLLRPDQSYLLAANNNPFRKLELATVQFSSGPQTNQDMELVLGFIGVRTHVPPEVFFDRIGDIKDGSVRILISYLMQIPSDEVDKLKSLRIFCKKTPVGHTEEQLRHRANELYPPITIFHQLQLPVISWDGEWLNDSGEAQLVYRLGLYRFPPLEEIIRLCSSSNASVRRAAFSYFCENLGSNYLDYNPDDFRCVAFIPVENGLRADVQLKTINDVCWDTQWKALGFFVVTLLTAEPGVTLRKLGIQQHPSPTILLDRLRKAPRDEEMASRWFVCLADCIPSLGEDHLTTLSGMQIVPTSTSGVLQWMTPTLCYLGRPKDEFTRELFTFVDFGTKANHFLRACGSKDEPSVKDLAECLVDDPERFRKVAKGNNGFLAKLRNLATEIKHTPNLNDTLEKMASKHTLLAVHYEYDGQDRATDVYELRKPEEIVIIDDTKDGELFSEFIWACPQEDLESFYALVGCRKLSMVIKEQYENPTEIEDHETSSAIKDLVLERLPIFLERCTNTRPKIPFNSFRDQFTVRVCDTLCISKTFTIGKNTTKTQEVWAATRSDTQTGIALWVSRSYAQRDIYDLAISLCRLVFGTVKGNDTLVLAAMLSDRELLKRAGFHGPSFNQDLKQRLCKGDEPSALHNAGQSVKGGPVSCRETQLSLFICFSRSPSQIMSQTFISELHVFQLNFLMMWHLPGDRVKSAIDASKRNHADMVQVPNACYYNDGGPIGSLQSCGEFRCLPFNQKLMLDTDTHLGVPESEFNVFMKDPDKHEPLGRFVGIAIPIVTVFDIPIPSLHIFYDLPGGPIAYNQAGQIYLNLRFFEEWHDADVKKGDQEQAQAFWFFALAHEIAHNLVTEHNSDHEFWFSAICEDHVAALSRILRSGTHQVEYNQGGFSRIASGLSSFLHRMKARGSGPYRSR
ncbi:hypothetical protein L210DRAFT_876000, partial [Boletus edulis BED1]